MRLYSKGQNVISECASLKKAGDLSGLVWIDLQTPTLDEIVDVEKKFHINIPTRMQQEEIESSSRFVEEDEYTIANSKFLQKTEEENQYFNANVSFLIKDDLLVTYREGEVKAFMECRKRIGINCKPYSIREKNISLPV